MMAFDFSRLSLFSLLGTSQAANEKREETPVSAG